MAYTKVPYRETEAYCAALFQSYGFTPSESQTITKVLLQADLFGIESHGIQRMIRYHNEITGGMVDVKAKPEIVFETPISAVIDAKKAMGQLVGVQAMELAIRKARETGVGMVNVRNSNHYGIAGFYANMALEHDLLGMCMTNSEAIMVPTFGRQGMLGTNPIALAMPADPTPFSFDAATTVVPRGKLEVYNKKGEPLPDGWALDQDGLPCTDASLVLSNIIHKRGGGILPLGGAGETNSGYKGYGFGMFCEIFTSILAGGQTSNYISSIGSYAGISHGFMALDYGVFGDKKEIRRHFSSFLQELRDSDKAAGQNRIYIQGEKGFENEADRKKNGIPLNEKTLEELKRIGREKGVSFSRFFGEKEI
jgi:L-2-hydroxycarboxylate dehydrogenase (NAD+)